MIDIEFAVEVASKVDSANYSTRVLFRRQYFDASYYEARDPRPFHIVLADREKDVHFAGAEYGWADEPIEDVRLANSHCS
jgi:hypothetical protein